MNGDWRYQSKMNANDMLSFVKKKVRIVCICAENGYTYPISKVVEIKFYFQNYVI